MGTAPLEADLVHLVHHAVLAQKLRNLGIDTEGFRPVPLPTPAQPDGR